MADLRVDRSDDLLVLQLDRPDHANALGPDVVEELIRVFESPTRQRLIVLQGRGRLFCSGFDLTGLDSLSDGDLLWRFVRIEHLLQLVQHSPVPVMCCAHRHAIGAGADLVASSHHRIVTADTRLRMPGFQFGVQLGTRRLAALVGADNAADLLIDARTIGAAEALSMGLVNEVIEKDGWDGAMKQALRRSVALSPTAQAALFDACRPDTRAADMASLVASAGTPGLRNRIADYRAKMAAAGRSGQPIGTDQEVPSSDGT